MPPARPAIPRSGVAVLLAVAAACVVAMAAADVALLLPPAELDAAWVRGVRMAGAGAALAGLVALLALRGRLRPDGRRDPDPAVAGLLAAGMTMAVLALLAPAVTPDAPSEAGSFSPSGGVAIDTEAPGTGPSPASRTAPSTRGYGTDAPVDEPDWRTARPDPAAAPEEEGFDRALLRRAALVLLLVLLAVLAAVGVRSLRAGPAAPVAEAEPAEGLAAEAAEAGLAASLTEVEHAGRDARGQITAAYRRLVAALSAAGSPPRACEAPHEHLDRALGPLGVRPGPMHRLADLYVVAQFSEHPLTERHRADAAEALEGSLSSLRRAAP